MIQLLINALLTRVIEVAQYIHIPGETDIEDIAFVEALNLANKFPVMESSSHIIPSTPAVYTHDPFVGKETAVTPLQEEKHEIEYKIFIKKLEMNRRMNFGLMDSPRMTITNPPFQLASRNIQGKNITTSSS